MSYRLRNENAMKDITSKVYTSDNLFGIQKKLELLVGSVNQITESAVIAGGEMAEHIQQCDEVVYAVSGSASVCINQEKFQFNRGEVLYIKNGCTHSFKASDTKNFRYICIGITPQRNYPPIEHFINATDNIPNYYVTQDNGTIGILSEQMMTELQMNDEQSEQMLNLYITQILITLSRYYQHLDCKNQNKNFIKASSHYAIYHILHYIDREYLNIYTIDDIVKNTSYSKSYIAHLFKKKLDITVKKYIMNKKMDKAQELLINSTLTVKEIAEYLNFTTSDTFSRAFKQYCGISPLCFRAGK